MTLNLISKAGMGIIKNRKSRTLEILRSQRRLSSLIHLRRILRKGQHKQSQHRQRKIFRGILIEVERVPTEIKR